MEIHFNKNRICRAFTLVEVVVSCALASLMIGVVLGGYVQATQRAEFTAYDLAAQSLAIQVLERARAAKWDPAAQPPVDELVGGLFPPVVEVLDLPTSGTNVVFATNYITITLHSIVPPVKSIRVDTVWRFFNRTSLRTNTMVALRCVDN